MAGYLRVADTWLQVRHVAVGHQVDYQRHVVIQTTLSQRRRAQVAPGPAHRDWQVRLGMATTENLRLWERLVDGMYGIGPFDWVDPFKAAAAEAANGPSPDGGPPPGALARPVVVASVVRADRRAVRDQQITAITITLSEVGPGVAG